MKIDYQYPTPPQFISNEIKTIEFLKNTPQIAKYHNQLYSDALEYHSKNYKGIQKKSLQQFDFQSRVDVFLDKAKGTKGICHLGAIITSTDNRYDKHSYYLTVCLVKKQRNLMLRKFHFDYAASSDHRQPHPTFHIQYPGELSPKLEALNLIHKHLGSWLSEPRLCYTPMSLALLINLVLKEFPSKESLEIIEDTGWRSLLKGNERLLLKPYYTNCHNFINSKSSDRLITNDYYYGN